LINVFTPIAPGRTKQATSCVTSVPRTRTRTRT